MDKHYWQVLASAYVIGIVLMAYFLFTL